MPSVMDDVLAGRIEVDHDFWPTQADAKAVMRGVFHDASKKVKDDHTQGLYKIVGFFRSHIIRRKVHFFHLKTTVYHKVRRSPTEVGKAIGGLVLPGWLNKLFGGVLTVAGKIRDRSLADQANELRARLLTTMKDPPLTDPEYWDMLKNYSFEVAMDKIQADVLKIHEAKKHILARKKASSCEDVIEFIYSVAYMHYRVARLQQDIVIFQVFTESISKEFGAGRGELREFEDLLQQYGEVTITGDWENFHTSCGDGCLLNRLKKLKPQLFSQPHARPKRHGARRRLK